MVTQYNPRTQVDEQEITISDESYHKEPQVAALEQCIQDFMASIQLLISQN